MDLAGLLAAYDAQLRVTVPDPLPTGWTVERDGPLVRFRGLADRNWVLYRDLGGLDGAAVDKLIGRQVRYFAELGQRFEWKYHGHDLPADLPERLVAYGFVPEDLETIEIGRVADIAVPPRLPEGVTLREVTARHDLDRIAAMEAAVWAEDYADFAAQLQVEIAADPTALKIVVAEVGDTVVSAGWMRFEPATEFATMGAAQRSPSGADAASTALSSRIGRISPPRAASGTSKPMHPRTADRSWSAWDSCP